jgi:hypothetical protein
MTEKSIILAAQDRLDKIDIDAIQALVYRYAQEAFGGLMGQANGCLSPFSVAFSQVGPVYYATLSAFSYAYSKGDLTRDNSAGTSIPASWLGRVLTFDPSEESYEQLDYTAARTAAVAGYALYSGEPNLDENGREVSEFDYIAWNRIRGGMPFIWATPQATDEDSDVRRRWDLVSKDETSYTTNRRTAIRSVLQVSDTQPTATAIAVGKFVGWNLSGGALSTPVIRPVMAWDNPDLYAPESEVSYEDSNRYTTRDLDIMEGASPYDQISQMGLGQLLLQIRKAIWNMKIGSNGRGESVSGDWSTPIFQSLYDALFLTPKATMKVVRSYDTTDITITYEALGKEPVTFTKTAPGSTHTVVVSSGDISSAGGDPTFFTSHDRMAASVEQGSNSGAGSATSWEACISYAPGQVQIYSHWADDTGARIEPGQTGWQATLNCFTYTTTVLFW